MRNINHHVKFSKIPFKLIISTATALVLVVVVSPVVSQESGAAVAEMFGLTGCMSEYIIDVEGSLW